MPRIGVLLVRAGVVSEESVNRALAVQGFAGGRLGTLLLERGSLSEGDVGKALAEQHGCAFIPWRALGSIAAGVIAALPAKFAIRHSAVPVELGEGFIRVALRDPANLRILDELFFVTGKKIIPSVAPEVRLYQALEKYYGERRTPRFAILAEKLSRPAISPVIKKPLPPPPDFSAAPSNFPIPSTATPSDDGDSPSGLSSWKIPDEPPVGWSGPAQRSEGEPDAEPESIPWEEMPTHPGWPVRWDTGPAPAASPPAATGSAEHSGASRPSPARPASSRAGAAAPAGDFARVLAGRSRDEIFEAVLATLVSRTRKRAVFAVRTDSVVGWSGSGEKVDVSALRSLDFPWSEPSIFLNLRMSRSFHLGPLPPLPRHRELTDALGGWPAECLVQPVLIRDKPVAFLYAESGSPQGATPRDIGYIRELAAAAASALATSIRLKKQRVI
jgi:hypothetical protein